jgi:hypothetical protein
MYKVNPDSLTLARPRPDASNPSDPVEKTLISAQKRHLQIIYLHAFASFVSRNAAI